VASDPVIEIRDASFSYNGSPALRDVNLSVGSRDFVCVVGPNGGGKTTLLKLILGLIRPQAGEVRVLGRRPERARKRIGYMPQYVDLDTAFPVTVSDVVLMGRLGIGARLGPYRRSDQRAALDALSEVGLVEVRDRPLAALSGGQRRRVLIARALASEPELLLLDEPNAHLDPAAQDRLYETLRDLNDRLTVVMVSHDLGFVSLYFKTVVCVHQDVHVHPTADLTQQRVADMYGREVRLVHGTHEAPRGGGA
jgi:zinc transport system ATP-binding protein